MFFSWFFLAEARWASSVYDVFPHIVEVMDGTLWFVGLILMFSMFNYCYPLRLVSVRKGEKYGIFVVKEWLYGFKIIVDRRI